MTDLMLLLAGAILCNCIPHLVSGVQGVPFTTPFARPRGVGKSSPLLNFIWGSSNLFIGLFIVWRRMGVIGLNLEVAALAVGFLASGLFLATHFGRVQMLARG